MRVRTRSKFTSSSLAPPVNSEEIKERYLYGIYSQKDLADFYKNGLISEKEIVEIMYERKVLK